MLTRLGSMNATKGQDRNGQEREGPAVAPNNTSQEPEQASSHATALLHIEAAAVHFWAGFSAAVAARSARTGLRSCDHGAEGRQRRE